MQNLNLNRNLEEEIIKQVRKTNNVYILIDYDNLYHTMKRYAIDVTDEEYNICKFFNTVYGTDKIRSFRAYADFDQVKISLRKLQEQRVQIRNVYGNNRDDKYRKNASDIELSIDAIESTYKESNIDTYVIVTSDSDMIPIMSRLKYKAKTIHLYYTSQNTSQITHFDTYCDFSCDLLQLFNIDLKRGEPEYWFDDIKTIISDWYTQKNNSNKLYGFTWLKDDVANKLNISDNYAYEILNIMIDMNIINKITNNNNISGFILSENPDRKLLTNRK